MNKSGIYAEESTLYIATYKDNVHSTYKLASYIATATYVGATVNSTLCYS